MESYIEKLDELIALKKNKGHKITKKESEEFVSAWSELIAAEGGFTEKAEHYFYDGFIFAGAKPFVKWVLLSDDKVSALDMLFKSHVFGSNTSSTFRVLVSTLAQLIKEKPDDKNLVCPLIKSIPSYSKNKENKTIGDGQRIVLKYFISEIDDASVLPVLAELDLKPEFINTFIALFDELLNRFDVNTLSKKDAHMLASVSRWLHHDKDECEPVKKDSEPERSDCEGRNEKPSMSTAQQKQDSLHQNRNPYDLLVSVLNEAIALSCGIQNTSKKQEQKCVALQEKISCLQRELETLNVQLKDVKRKESALEELLADRSSQISCLNLKIESLEETIQKMSSDIEAKDQEISQRTQMIEALSRDRAKQSDEQLHRLASKLKVEYRDFRDAEALTMDCDLGENMREQLKNIFAILIKAGISLD